MALTVQNIVDSVSNDMRKVLSNSGADATLMIDWVDRIHKDALHSGIFSFLNVTAITQATSAGTGTYALSPTDIRRIIQVYDRTFDRVLLPIRQLTPLPQRDQSDHEGADYDKGPALARTMGKFPEYYDLLGTVTFRIFPAPTVAAFASTLEIYYEKHVVTLTTLAGTLVVPEDGKDMVVAGVNFMAASYLKREDEAKQWFGIYEKLKKGESVS